VHIVYMHIYMHVHGSELTTGRYGSYG